MKVLFLFGAGASHGCHGASDYSGKEPPLGRQLFDRLRDFSELWAREPEGVFREDFELGLRAVLQDGDGRRAWPLMVEMQRYLWTLRLGEASTYQQFAEALRATGAEIVLSTLNYDVLLEYACDHAGVPVHYAFGDGAGLGAWPLYKLHGSISWVSGANFIAGGASAVDIQLGYCRFVGTYREFEASLASNELGAIISLYEPGKVTLLERRLVEAIRDSWADQVRGCDALVCIGVKPVHHDEHVWGPIGESSAPIFVVGYDDETREDWNALRRGGTWRPIGDDFAKSIHAIRDAVSDLEARG